MQLFVFAHLILNLCPLKIFNSLQSFFFSFLIGFWLNFFKLPIILCVSKNCSWSSNSLWFVLWMFITLNLLAHVYPVNYLFPSPHPKKKNERRGLFSVCIHLVCLRIDYLYKSTIEMPVLDHSLKNISCTFWSVLQEKKHWDAWLWPWNGCLWVNRLSHVMMKRTLHSLGWYAFFSHIEIWLAFGFCIKLLGTLLDVVSLLFWKASGVLNYIPYELNLLF